MAVTAAPKTGKKPPRFLRIVFTVLIVLAALPLVLAGLSFIGRVEPEQIIPDSFHFYGRIRNPVRFAGKILSHESLPEILALPALAPYAPLALQLRDSGITNHPLLNFAARGRLDFALLEGGHFLAAWNTGLLSPLLKIAPAIAGRLGIRQLYYVQAGKYSRFEYRPGGNSVIYIGVYRNLLLASDDPALFESVLDSSSRDGDPRGSNSKVFTAGEQDAAFLALPEALFNNLGGSGAALRAVTDRITFPRFIEAGVTLHPGRLDIILRSPLASNHEALGKVLSLSSTAPFIVRFLPRTTQYATFVSAGNLRELAAAAELFAGPDMNNALKKADSAIRAFFRMNLEDLLYSWSGNEIGIFGIEGRASPVYAVQIRDERQRQEIFRRVFSSVFVEENISLNLDGNRIPRIQIPSFLSSVMGIMGITSPAPYYLVYNDYLAVSESAETLLGWLNSMRRNEILPGTRLWQNLSGAGTDRASAGLFYSLDRSLPFFLKGNTLLSGILRIYRQGFLRLRLEDSIAVINLSVIPGAGKGLRLSAGYPVEPGGKTGNGVYVLRPGRETRLAFTLDNIPAALNPADKSVRKAAGISAGSAPLRIIPAQGLPARTGKDAALWAAGGGMVSLVNADMEVMEGFPVVLGLRSSAPPSAYRGRLYLCGEDGSVLVIDAGGKQSFWGLRAGDPIRSPIAFLDADGESYAVFYSKSFPGEIVLAGTEGNIRSGWPLEAPGIAYGTPLLFTRNNKLHIAFVTMAGELWVYDERGIPLPPFPGEFEGVFYLQPVDDGEYLWLVSGEGVLYRAGPAGDTASRKIPNLAVRENGYITTADIDGDGIPEIFITGEGNALHGYTRSLEPLPGFPLPVWGRPAFIVTGSGVELAGAGMDNRIYRWQFK